MIAHGARMRIALYQPDIPQNTGTILRLGACFGVPVDVIGPPGFAWDDRRLKRAGLDYGDLAEVTRHTSWPSFLATRPPGRLILLTTAADAHYHRFAFAPDDILLFGRESAGAPAEVHAACDMRLKVPIKARSLNVAVTVGIVLAEALRQCEGFP
jgi:tRNA (cytidine/uridine-2'-O-)-methyltransferase